MFEDNFEELTIEQSKIRNEIKDTGNIRDYLIREMGLGDKFITGDKENPIEISTNELTDKQILNIYKHFNNNSTPHITQEEYNIINSIRSGEFDEHLSELINNSQRQNDVQYTDYDFYYWKMKSDFPSLTDEEIYNEYELDKESESFNKKINSIIKQYYELEELERLSREQENKLREHEEIELEKNNIVDLLDSYSYLHNFEIPIEIKHSVLEDIFNSDNNETSNFIAKYVDNPKGLIYTATAVKMLPLIAKEYEILRREYEALKNGSLNVISNEEETNSRDNYQNLFN